MGLTWEFLGFAERSRGWSTPDALSWCACMLTWGASLGGRHHCGSNVGYVPRAAATTDAAMGSTWTDIGDSADRELLLLSLWGLCQPKHNSITIRESKHHKEKFWGVLDRNAIWIDHLHYKFIICIRNFITCFLGFSVTFLYSSLDFWAQQ